MSTIWVVLIAIAALAIGVALGFFIARKYMMSYLKKNPPINEQMLRTMMMTKGQKPSQNEIKQTMRSTNNQMDKNDKTDKKKKYSVKLTSDRREVSFYLIKLYFIFRAL